MVAIEKAQLVGKVAVAESLFGPHWKDFIRGIVWELVDQIDDVEKNEPFLQVKFLWITRTITVGQVLGVIARIVGER